MKDFGVPLYPDSVRQNHVPIVNSPGVGTVPRGRHNLGVAFKMPLKQANILAIAAILSVIGAMACGLLPTPTQQLTSPTPGLSDCSVRCSGSATSLCRACRCIGLRARPLPVRAGSGSPGTDSSSIGLLTSGFDFQRRQPARIRNDWK